LEPLQLVQSSQNRPRERDFVSPDTRKRASLVIERQREIQKRVIELRARFFDPLGGALVSLALLWLLGLGKDRTVVRFQMAGVVRLDRDEAGKWEVRWVFPPELLPPR
jgi:hypothetical protein